MQKRIVQVAVVLLVVGIVVAAAAVSDFGNRRTAERSPSSVGTSPQPSPSAPGEDGPFPGFWPESTYEKARSAQEAFDGGSDPWRAEPKEVASRFIAEFGGWKSEIEIDGNKFKAGVDTQEPTIAGSRTEGWRATVVFRRYRVDGAKRSMGAMDTVDLIGLEGVDRPAWFVSGLRSPNLDVAAPSSADTVSSPFSLSGRGTGYEGTIRTEMRDDKGATLDSSFVTGGATEPAPFQGSISFTSPSTASGILVLTPDSGAEGPPISMAVVRLYFATPPTPPS